MKRIPGDQEVAGQIHLSNGSGNFLIEDSRDASKKIRVFYYKPREFNQDSRILMVLPGTGRNGDDYRNSWVELSEKYNVLILSPSFNEIYYYFESYHLGGLRKIEGTNKVELEETLLTYEINTEESQWIYRQFDRIFDLTTESLGSTQKTYDLFGHSAGGHILHRMALFYTGEKADRILASNASFYTLPTREYRYPFGTGNLSFSEEDLLHAFRNNLVVFLGEKDNEMETSGTFLISESADQQGSHRFARGTHFFEVCKEIARAKKMRFNWKLVTISGVGHDYRKMAVAAGRYLYQNP
ncbi:MAG: hypothetical protein P8Z38_13120 [Robiginitalea sp.]